jgi:hypothetical protein
VIVVLAGRGTAGVVRRLLRSWDRPGVSVLPPAGLSVRGWAHDPEHPADDRVVLDGRDVRPDELTGVVTALDAVLPGDLPHVAAADRGFVAAEMTAFLRDWLATLACPVIDRPTALALSGRAAQRAAWTAAAATLGITERLGTAAVPVTAVITVRVVAGQVIGPVRTAPGFLPGPGSAAGQARAVPSGQVPAAALALARAAGVTAVRLLFTEEAGDPVLIGAVPWWHVPSPLVLRAVLGQAEAHAEQSGTERQAAR